VSLASVAPSLLIYCRSVGQRRRLLSSS
jgi:hypothetical protein